MSGGAKRSNKGTGWLGAHRRARCRRQKYGSEMGVTLIEMLVVLVILPIIVGAVAFAFIEILDEQGSVSRSLSDSADEQVVSANFVQDVQSAQYFTTDPTPTSITVSQPNTATAPSQCGPAKSTTVAPLVGLEWDGYTSSFTTPANPTPQVFQTVVFYDSVQQPLVTGQTTPTYWLVRYACSGGGSSNPANYTSSTVSSNFCPPSPPSPACSPSSTTQVSGTVTGEASGWISVLGVSAITLNVEEPVQTTAGQFNGNDLQSPSGYNFTLNGEPEQVRIGGTVNPPPTGASSCGFASTGTGSLSQTLCYTDSSGFNWTTASTSTTSCPKVAGQPVTGQWVDSAITGTPYYLSYCLTASGGQSGPVPIPTYYYPNPNTGYASEAYLGNNGFYTGISGEPAIYQCSGAYSGASSYQTIGGNSVGWTTGTPGVGNEISSSCTQSANAQTTTLKYTQISVTDADGNGAQGWELVTGDAESTDTNEWIAWTTCPAFQNSTSPVNPGPSTQLVGSNCGSSPSFQLLYNSSSSAFGNACSWAGVTNPTSSLIPNGTFIEPPLYAGAPTAQNSVECAENIQANKTGTLMLEALQPSTLSIEMHGAGLQAVFLGVLLP